MDQPTLVRVCIPDDKEFTVCGDIHGQFYDLLNIFEINGMPSSNNPYVRINNNYYASPDLVDWRNVPDPAAFQWRLRRPGLVFRRMYFCFVWIQTIIS
jgi:hypothetical protein